MTALDGWTEATLGDCVNLVSGGTPSKDNPEYWGGTVPWLSAKDMKVFRVHDTEDHLTEAGAREATRIVPTGTVLLLTRGMTLLNDVPICVAQQDMTFNQDVKALSPRTRVEPCFVPYLLLALKPRLLDMVDLAGRGTGRLNSDSLRAIEVRLPPSNEQRAMAHILGTLDDKIEMNRRMNETLESTARALFKSWFVDFDPIRAKAEGRRPVGMDAETAALFPRAFVDSELGKIPKGWSIAPIGECVRVVGGSTPSTEEPAYWDGAIAFATPKDLAGLTAPVVLNTERQITEKGAQRISSGVLPPGTVLLSSRAPIGYLAISALPIAVNQGFIAMVCDGSLPNYYILQWVRWSMDTIIANANGTTFLEISKSNFRPIPALVPSANVLSAFVSAVEPLHTRVVAGLRESRSLANLRDALLPELLFGKMRVKDAEKFAEARLP